MTSILPRVGPGARRFAGMRRTRLTNSCEPCATDRQYKGPPKIDVDCSRFEQSIGHAYGVTMASPVEGVELETLLAEAARDPAVRPRFAQAMLDAEVLVLGIIVQGTDGGAELQIVRLDSAQGQVMPMFSSIVMLNATLAVRPDLDPRFLRMRCRSLWSAMPGVRFTLNPHGPGKQFTPSEVASLLAGTEPGVRTETVAESRDVLIGQPSHIPPRLIPVLSAFFSTRPAVSAVRLGWIAHPDGARGYVITVAALDRQQAMRGFGSIGIGEFTDGHTIDVFVEPDDRPPQLLANIDPFYVRGS